MSLEDRVREAEEEIQRASVARRVAPWFALALVAIVLLELFAHPLLAASVFCLKFAFNDFRTAAWLFRRDPIRGRRWATSLLYIAVGFWKAAVVNYGVFAVAIAYTLLAGEPAWPQRPPNAPAAEFLDDPLTPWAAPTIFAHAIEFFIGGVALTIAYVNHQKLWLSPRIHEARRHDLWPPDDDRGVNWLRWLPMISAAALPVMLCAVSSLLLILIEPPAAVNAKEWGLILPLVSGFALFLTLPPLILTGCVQDKKNRYLLALTPEECWPLE